VGVIKNPIVVFRRGNAILECIWGSTVLPRVGEAVRMPNEPSESNAAVPTLRVVEVRHQITIKEYEIDVHRIVIELE